MVGLNRTHQTSHAVRESSQKRISRSSESKFAQYELLKSWYWHGKPQSACPSICKRPAWVSLAPDSDYWVTPIHCNFEQQISACFDRWDFLTSHHHFTLNKHLFHNLYQHTWFDLVFGKFIFTPLKSSSPLMTCNSSCLMWSNFFHIVDWTFDFLISHIYRTGHHHVACPGFSGIKITVDSSLSLSTKARHTSDTHSLSLCFSLRWHTHATHTLSLSLLCFTLDAMKSNR